MRASAFKRYVTGFAALVGVGLGLLAGFNALVNPFNIYDGPRLSGFNDYKYKLATHSRLSKAAEVRRLHPDCLILGSSRAQIGLDPAHPAWSDCTAYNLAQNGGTLYEAMRYLQHAEAVRKPRDVVLALDLLMFNIYRPLRQPGFTEERLMTGADGTPNPAWRRAYAYDVFSGLLSSQTLKASWATVFPPTVSVRRARGPEDGFWEYLRPDTAFLTRRGQREVFRRNEEAFLTEHWFPAPRHQFRTRDPQSGADTYEYLRTILRLAHRDNVKLSMLISPAHARQWETLRQAGLWNEFEAWKRMLVQVNDDEARRAGHAPFALWDFSGYNTYTTEAVPAEGDRTSEMRWYWESSHYRKELGERVLDRVLGYRAAERAIAPDFGVRLDARRLETQLAAIRAGQRRWQQTHAADVDEIAVLARRTASWRVP
jgi:hypothetical protein